MSRRCNSCAYYCEDAELKNQGACSASYDLGGYHRTYAETFACDSYQYFAFDYDELAEVARDMYECHVASGLYSLEREEWMQRLADCGIEV